MSRHALLAAGLTLALLASGCSGSFAPEGSLRSATAPKVSGTGAYTSKYLQQRRDAGIADCPASDPSVGVAPNGLPDVTLECFGASSWVRLAGLRGKPMVINVWAQWCGPCRLEAPALAEASKNLKGRVQFLGIDHADPDPEAALAFAAESGWQYPQVVDLKRASAAGLQLAGLPQTLFVDADGVIVGRHPGAFESAADIEALVSKYLQVG